MTECQDTGRRSRLRVSRHVKEVVTRRHDAAGGTAWHGWQSQSHCVIEMLVECLSRTMPSCSSPILRTDRVVAAQTAAPTGLPLRVN